MDKDKLPVEVSLVADVRKCRSCAWFWQGIPPYGPYPAYGWTEEFPPQARESGPQPSPDEKPISPTAWLRGSQEGAKLVEPGIMHGCRMAPIMTVGINPNMTAWFPYASSAGWTYPSLGSDASYAYYYRHFTIYQETLSRDLVLQGISATEHLVAENDGEFIGATRGNSHNYIELKVRYKGHDHDTVLPIVFTPEARWVVLQQEKSFSRGTLLAGRFDPPAGIKAPILKSPAGYYQRMIPVLERFKEKVGLDDASLTVGEDVAQHDMVGCASPGWQTKYDMPKATIAGNCVTRHGWLVRQFLQSQPKVVILVGGSALEMFRSVFGPYMTMENADADIYQLLAETCARPTYVTIEIGTIKFRSRVLTPPHFSYSDNFKSQSRLSPEAWVAFRKDFAPDAELLEKEKRVAKPSSTGYIPVEIKKEGDPLQAQISVAGWQVLMAYYMAPYERLADALAQEYRNGSLAFDKSTKHLERVQQACHYCVNPLWAFPEGCPYGNTTLPLSPDADIEKAVAAILEKARSQS